MTHHHREVAVAVCGIVLGTMLGAGSLVLSRDVTASVQESDAEFVAYRQGFIFEDQYRKRAISEDDRRTRNQAPLDTFEELYSAPPPEDATLVNVEECIQKVRYAEEIRALVIPLIPGRAIDQLVRSSIQQAFDDYVEDCLPYYEEWSNSQASGGSNAGVDVLEETLFENDPAFCNRYTGVQRSRCRAEQRERENR